MNQSANYDRFQILKTLALPIAIGLGLFWLMGLMIEKEVLTNELLLRYLVGHPISKFTTFLFLIGVAALLLIANNIFDQFCNCGRIVLKTDPDQQESETEESRQPSARAKAECLLGQMNEYKSSLKSQYLWRRLAAALGFIQRTGSTSGIEDELKYLSDMDRERKHHRYALVRILIWATPMLGFLGTVLGISQALGGIQVGADSDFQQMLNSLRSSLFVAFDTTALALTLSMLLMFCQFFIDRFESHLLEIVDRRTRDELGTIYETRSDAPLNSLTIDELGINLIDGVDRLTNRQTEVWEKSIKSSELAWAHSIAGVQRAVNTSLAKSLDDAASQIAKTISESTRCLDDRLNDRIESWQVMLAENSANMNSRWEQWQVLLSDNARQLSQSQELVNDQLRMTRELLEQVNGYRQNLDSNEALYPEKPTEITAAPDEAVSLADLGNENDCPTPKLIPIDRAASQGNQSFRFVTRPLKNNDAA